ncbi:MAG: filamentous hemagglutinin N-terminal domain-containing protein [Limnothrix sp. RL_2_0]|nr:filamentous hemagglutinin N-terminal domain-containing protein [Limnothrix sp. RL_2_0]
MVNLFNMMCKILGGDRQQWLLFCCAVFGQGLATPTVTAQITNITSDGTLGTTIDSTTTPGEHFIQGGTAAGGQNLFHSFSEFSILNNDIAIFQNTATQTNIFARITGENVTKIGGGIETASKANLFLINPNGIEFVDGIKSFIFLDGGDFIATTASEILFPNNQTFSQTTTSNEALLLVTAPIGLNIGVDSKDIRVNGNLDSFGNNTFLLGNGLSFGSNTSIKSLFEGAENFTVGRGDAALLSIAPNSIVDLTSGFPTVNTSKISGSDITFQNYSFSQFLDKETLDRLYVFGKNIFLNNADIRPDAVRLENDEGGLVTFEAQEKIILSNQSLIDTDNLAEGVGNILNFKAKQIQINDSVISSDTFQDGDGGDISFQAETVEILNGSVVSSSSDGGATGDTGVVRFDVGSLKVLGQDAAGNGNRIFVETLGTGEALGLDIKAKQVILRDGARFSVSSLGEGGSGVAVIEASEFVELSGKDNLSNPTGLFAEVLGSGSGAARGIVVSTPKLLIQDGAIISAGNTSAGNALVGTGQPGDIEITTSDLRLLNGAKIITNAAIADGGNISIETQTLVALFDSDISANAEAGAGGRIFITAKGIFGTAFRDRLTPKSDITATSNLGPQFNGVVTITTPDVDPTSGLTKLPTDIVDASDQIAATCAAAKGNSFALVGRGGIPENPQVALTNAGLWQDLQSYVGAGEDEKVQAIAPNFVPEQIVETPSDSIQGISGWQLNRQGQVELVTQVAAGINPDLISCNHSPNAMPKNS